jgi:hypothetical protein
LRQEQITALLPAKDSVLAVIGQIAGNPKICQGVEDEYAIIKIGQRS